MDRFDTSVALLISAIVGAGVFALPSLSVEMGLTSILIVSLAFVYMLGLGYLIIDMYPGSVEDEVERFLGTRARNAIVIIEYAIVFLALTAYLKALKTHLGVQDILIFTMAILPLVMQLHLPAPFTNVLAFFLLAFISLLTLMTIPLMELPATLSQAGTLPSPISASLLFFAAAFAFYGHNLLPRIRNIIRDKEKAHQIFHTAISIVFLLYMPFTVALAGMGADSLATKFLSTALAAPWGAFTGLLAIIIFYTSFVLFSMKLLDDMGHNRRGLAMVTIGTAVLYYLAQIGSIPFHVIISAAGLGVTAYAAVVSYAAIKAEKRLPLAYLNLGLTALSWLMILITLL